MDYINDFWNKLAEVPKEFIKLIGGGRLKGFSDINPQWRIKAMTEIFGPMGFGWKYTVDRMWTEPGCANQVFAFVNISLFINLEGKWSDAIPGSGGSMLVVQESAGLRSNDEAFKMATTDALSVAMKQIGVGSKIYEGRWDGSKYLGDVNAILPPSGAQGQDQTKKPHEAGAQVQAAQGQAQEKPPTTREVNQAMNNQERKSAGKIDSEQFDALKALLSAAKIPSKVWREWLMDCYKFDSMASISAEAYHGIKYVVETNPQQIINYKRREPGQD